jgi:hypothetical protein
MWALDISFSTVWIGLLGVQASALSIQVLRVFYLHVLVHGPLGVMFTLYLDLYRALLPSGKVLDELYWEVSLLVLKSYINSKLQKPHASANMTYHEG